MRRSFASAVRVAVPCAVLLALLLGARGAHASCPPAWNDAGVSDPGLSPGVFPASIEGVHAFAVAGGIRSLSELLAFLPDDMKSNYSFLEVTGTPNQASVDFPRQIVFTADTAFAVAFNTHPSMGSWEQADMMELGEDGEWRFRALVFEQGVPRLHADDAACRGCHAASPNNPPEADAPLVPRWGPYPSWPGAFGDREHSGKDQVTAAQATALNRWLSQPPERIAALNLKRLQYSATRPFVLPAKPGTSALNHINIDLAPRHGQSIHRRIRRDADYPAHRYDYLAQSYCSRHPAWQSSGARERVLARAAALGTTPSWQGYWRAFGIPHPEYEVDLAALPGQPTAPNWGDAYDGIRQYADILVLKELVDEDPGVDAALRSVADEDSFFSDGCFENKRQALDWVLLYNWSERSLHQEIRQHRAENMRAWRSVFHESQQALCPALFEGILATPAPTPQP